MNTGKPPAARGLLLAVSVSVGVLVAGQPDRFTAALVGGVTWRNLGPFRAGAWVSALAVPEAPPRAHLYTFYVATRSGGLWKTTNNGTTFEPTFEDQGVSSIGAVAVAASNDQVVWVGTGDPASARSSYWGDGVYRSTDAGRTWRHMGLEDTQHIARIAIHPTNPDVVYVAALGHLYTANEARGLFKTTDGGRTWRKVLDLGDRVGVVDLVMRRDRPDTLYAAAYEKQRLPWTFIESGPGSGIYKTTDGGRRWTRLAGGLPEGRIGRIGLDLFQRQPDTVYAVVENANLRDPTEAERAADRRRGREPQPRQIGGEVYRTTDGGRAWHKMNADDDSIGGKAMYSFSQIRVSPGDPERIFVTSDVVANSSDGGRTWKDLQWPPRTFFPKMFGDVRTMWIDPQDPDRIMLGTDGGVQLSYDGGKSSDFFDNLPLGEVYGVGVDMDDPYHVYAGLQDHEHWRGPSQSWSGRVTLEDWITVGTGDGMYTQVDPDDSRWLYTTGQFGDHTRVDQRLRVRTSIQPSRPAGQPPLRFNWIAPIAISPHNSRTIYAGAQVLFRSLDRGDHWQEVSPDLTRDDPEKIAGRNNVTYCTITTISESPVTPGVIWVGTDDGRVQLTRNGGVTWTDATPALVRAGAPDEVWVSRVLASPHDASTAFVTKTGYRNDDFRPFVYVTTDAGATWTSIGAGLPARPVNVIVQDRRNPDLLFVGTDGGVYVSIDRGARWVPLKGNMPVVPVHDLVVHPREQDLVAGTYGRGLWITNIAPLQQMTAAVLEEPAYLFDVRPAALFTTSGWGNYDLYGDRHLATPNDPAGFVVTYYLREPFSGPPSLTFSDPWGETLHEAKGTGDAGLNRVVWDFGRDAPRPGEYLVTLTVGDRTLTRRARVRLSGR
jgi:photosystem II stability/assembly factor-like uncharacterized protein